MDFISIITAVIVAVLTIALSASGNSAILIRIAMIIAGIGAINWGLQTFLNINAVKVIAVTAGNSTLENNIYALVATFGVISVIGAFFPH